MLNLLVLIIDLYSQFRHFLSQEISIKGSKEVDWINLAIIKYLGDAFLIPRLQLKVFGSLIFMWLSLTKVIVILLSHAHCGIFCFVQLHPQSIYFIFKFIYLQLCSLHILICFAQSLLKVSPIFQWYFVVSQMNFRAVYPRKLCIYTKYPSKNENKTHTSSLPQLTSFTYLWIIFVSSTPSSFWARSSFAYFNILQNFFLVADRHL